MWGLGSKHFKGGLCRELYTRLQNGILKGILGVSTMAHIGLGFRV